MKKDELRFEALKLALSRHGQTTDLPIVFQTADKFLAYINHQIPTGQHAPERIIYTEEQLNEYILVAQDVVEFAKRTKLITVEHGLVPFKPFAHQEDLLRRIETDQYVVVTAARQMGTTTAVVVSVLHELLFKQDQTVLMVAPSLANAMEFLDRLKLAYENLPPHLVPKTVEYSKSRVSFDNGSRIFVGSVGSGMGRGLALSTLVIQDAAWLSHSVGREFFDGIYPCLAVGSGRNRCIVYSAAHDTDGMFYDLNQSAEKNGFARISIPWQHHPERDDAWAAATRAVIGKADFARQFECKFVSIDKVKKGR